MNIPEKGRTKEDVFRQMEEYRGNDLETHGGRTWAYVYDHGRREVEAAAKEAYVMFLSENGLDPTAFPSLLRIENDLVGMALTHLNGGRDAAGTFTSGGTESIMLAVKAARDFYREKKPEIKRPEMVLPVTAHAAFHKAAHYMDIRPVLVPVNEHTFKADPAAMRAAVTPDTILLVGSAVSYAHGVVDPIGALGELALERDLWLHVDACVGGWLLPYFRRLGEPVPDFDFTISGVTSMSMDFHKYAYCPKGASVVLYRNKGYRKYQIFACAGWTGYAVVNTAIQSSKSGGPMAAAWAELQLLGDDGYLEIAEKTLTATRKVIAGLGAIPELDIMSKPEFCLVAFTSEEINIFHLLDEMRALGWYLQPQLASGGSRENVHLSITAAGLPRVDDMLEALRQCVARVKTMGAGGAGPLKEALAQLDFEQMTDESLSEMLAMAGIGSGGLPDRMAEINELMNALPPEAREKVLIAYFNDLFCQPSSFSSPAAMR